MRRPWRGILRAAVLHRGDALPLTNVSSVDHAHTRGMAGRCAGWQSSALCALSRAAGTLACAAACCTPYTSRTCSPCCMHLSVLHDLHVISGLPQLCFAVCQNTPHTKVSEGCTRAGGHCRRTHIFSCPLHNTKAGQALHQNHDHKNRPQNRPHQPQRALLHNCA